MTAMPSTTTPFMPLGWAAGLLLATAAIHPAAAQPHAAPLIVVEDRGGVSALPYYQALDPQDAPPAAAAPAQPASPAPAPRPGSAADAEAAMLPVRSALLTPGDEPARVIRAPGLNPLFLVGDDDRSRAWLHEHQAELVSLHAVGLVVNVSTAAALVVLRHLVPDLMLAPTPADDLAQRLGVRHYPVLITATGIAP